MICRLVREPQAAIWSQVDTDRHLLKLPVWITLVMKFT